MKQLQTTDEVVPMEDEDNTRIRKARAEWFRMLSRDPDLEKLYLSPHEIEKVKEEAEEDAAEAEGFREMDIGQKVSLKSVLYLFYINTAVEYGIAIGYQEARKKYKTKEE